MKQSKLLKKSLAALLAILMVAAMIPMSAFAEDAPAAPAEKPAYIESLKLGVGTADTEATWDAGLGENGGFKVALSGIRVGSTNNAEHVKISWLRTAGQSGTLRVSGASTWAGGTVGAVSELNLANAASATATSPETGEYTFNLTDGTTTWPLVIDWTRREASADATIRRVNYRALDNVLGAEVGENTITLTMGFGQTRQVASTVPNFAVNGASAAAVAAAKSIFIPNNGGATVVVTDNTAGNGVLTVTAESGLTKAYSIKYVNEPAITKFELPGQVGETVIDHAAQTITLNMPYGTTAADLNKMTATMDWGDNVNTVNTKTAKEQKIAGFSDGATTNGVKTISSTAMVIATKRGAATNNTYSVDVKVPVINTEAKINSIRLRQNETDNSSKTEIGQTINIVDNGQDVQNVTITLPNGTAMDAGSGKTWEAVLDASTGAKFKIDRNSDTYGALANFGQTLKNSFTIDVESQDGKAHKYYNFTVATAANTDENLESVSITDGETTYTGVKTAADTFTITVPYAKGVGKWTADSAKSKLLAGAFPLAGWTVNAKATNGTTVTYTGFVNSEVLTHLGDITQNSVSTASAANVLFEDGATVLGAMYSAKDKEIGASDSTGIVVSVNNGTGSTWHIKIARSAANKIGVISDAAFTTATSAAAVEDSNTFSAAVATSGDNGTIKATIPYTARSGNAYYFSEMKISDGAVALLIGTDPAKGATATLDAVSSDNTKTANASKISAHGDTNGAEVIAAATWAAQTGQTATPVKLYVFSEEAWGDVKDLPFVAEVDNATAGEDYITAAILKESATTVYDLTAEYPAPATGAQLLSIESTVDKNVTAAYANNEVTITVPSTYTNSAIPSRTAPTKWFTLNWAVSDKAEVALRDSAGKTEQLANLSAKWTSDEGKENTAATRFAVYDGKIYFATTGFDTADNWAEVKDENSNAAANTGCAMAVVAEDQNTINPITINVKVTPAETGADMTSLLVGDVAAEADPDNDTTAVKAWKVTLPYGTSLNQPLNITASRMAAITVDGVSYDASANDIFDLTDGATIKVTSEDTKTSNTYKLTVAFGDPSTEADITAAKVGEVDASIAGETITAVVPEDFDFTQAVAVSFTVSEGAKVTKLGEAAPTATYTFTDGEPVAVEVTAQDGETTKTYQLIVTTKKPSSENAITELTVDGAAATAGEENAFTAEAADPANVTLGIKVSEGATVTVNGEEYTAGDSINATEPVTIVVTAEDGTEATYTLTVTKKADKPAPDDVDGDAWYAKYVADVLERGIMSAPNGKFQPDRKVTRAEFAVMMCNLNGVDPNEYANAENPFTDVKNDWSFKWIMAAVANKWMSGTSSTTFAPSKYLTREEAALIIANTQNLTKVTDPSALYADDAQISVWAKGGVYACKDAGLMGGTSASKNIFEPKKYLTRAQIATILTHINPEPNEPENPDEGNTPENPDEGSTPENPDEGNTPETPDEGNTPENPDEGNTPETPDEGNTPETPDEGNTPETPAE